MGQDPEQEVGRAVPGLATRPPARRPPPRSHRHPSRSNFPQCRPPAPTWDCSRPPVQFDCSRRSGTEDTGSGVPASGRARRAAGGDGSEPGGPPRPSPPPHPQARAGVRMRISPCTAPIHTGPQLRSHSPTYRAQVARDPRSRARHAAPEPRRPRPRRFSQWAARPPGAGQSRGAGGAEGRLHHPLAPRPRPPPPPPGLPRPRVRAPATARGDRALRCCGWRGPPRSGRGGGSPRGAC